MSGDSGVGRPFEMAIRDEGALTVITLGGELDLVTSDELRKALGTALAGNKSVVVNLAGLAFMDSSGLTLFIEMWKSQQERGNGLFLANPVPLIRDVLEITRLDQVIPIFENETDAVAAARSAL